MLRPAGRRTSLDVPLSRVSGRSVPPVLDDVTVDPEALAERAVEQLVARGAQYDAYSSLESAEVVRLDGEPGIAMTWTQTTKDQGTRRFGLLMTVTELRSASRGTRSGHDYDGWIEDLVLAVQEPHATSAPEGVRTWWRSIP